MGTDRPRFGTDGVRGRALVDLSTGFVHALGRATARVLGTAQPFLTARDTRESGPALEAALAAGLAAEGATVTSCGVLPTPGLAHLAARRGAAAAMVSASHNPWPDNGVKVFAAAGGKITDAEQAAIEAELDALLAGAPTEVDAPEPPSEPGAAEAYVAHLVGALEGRRLDGLRVVVDCGNGAASAVAPAALRALGAEVQVLHAAPDGRNINAGCGSTDPAPLARVVVETAADAGLAFDGDADRIVMVDAGGAIVDGDEILAVLALDLDARGRLPGRAVVSTVMANLGLRGALAAHGIGLVETPVGDRFVRAAMDEHGLLLGGEQSGHVILAEHAATGDGTLTGIVVLDAMVRAQRPLADLAAVVTKAPQCLRNVRVADRSGLDAADAFWTEVAHLEADLGDRGRVLVRPSGTEPVVRVMVEALDPGAAESGADRLAAALTAALGSA
ncbi:MAG: phosphoglucosamine mutase [Actinomycetes bacterium]